MEMDEAAHDKLFLEEYKIWKKNTPFLYDLVMTHALEWPSLTVQWLPEAKPEKDRDVVGHKLVLGTHTSGTELNYLMVADVLLPKPETQVDAKKFDEEKGEVGGYAGTPCQVKMKIKMVHEGEVNRARVNPFNSVSLSLLLLSFSSLSLSFSSLPPSPLSPLIVLSHPLLLSVLISSVCHRHQVAQQHGLRLRLQQARLHAPRQPQPPPAPLHRALARGLRSVLVSSYSRPTAVRL